MQHGKFMGMSGTYLILNSVAMTYKPLVIKDNHRDAKKARINCN